VGEEGIPLFMQVGDGNELDQNALFPVGSSCLYQWD
jgi:transposase